MHVGEIAQRRTCAPVRQAVKREMDHHRAGTGAEFRDAFRKAGSRRRLGDEFAEHDFRVRVGDDLARLQTTPAGERDARRRARAGLDSRDAVAENEFPALCFERANHRPDDRVGAALPNHHAEALVDHAFEVRKEGAARDVGREVEMQPPGRHHRLNLGMCETGVEKVAGRGEQEPQRFVDPAQALLAPGFADDARGGPGGHRRAEKAEQERRVAAEAGEQRAPGLCIRRRQRLYASDGLLKRTADAKIAAVTKHAGEAIFGGGEGEALRQQRLLVRGEERRACEHRQVHRAEVVAEPGQRRLARLHGAAGLVLAFDDGDAPTLLRKPDRRRKTVVARADDNRVQRHSSPPHPMPIQIFRRTTASAGRG